MSPHDGPRHDRTITQSDTPPPGGAPVSGRADAYDEAYDEYGDALYDDEPQGPSVDEEVANAGWSMWDDDWHGPRHGPPSRPTAAVGAPQRSDAYRTGAAGAVGPPTPSTGQAAAVGARTGGTRAAAPGVRPLLVAGVIALWVGSLVGGLMIGASTGDDGGDGGDRLVTVEPEEVEGDWRETPVPGGGTATSQPAAAGDDPTDRPAGAGRPTTTARPDVTRPETTTTTEGEPSGGGSTTTTEPEETTTTSSSTTTSTTAPSTTSTTADPGTTTTTVAAAALRSVLPV